MGEPVEIVVVTGLSGAGKTQALKSLEDLGYEAVDNLPLHLLHAVAPDGSDNNTPKKLALGVDVRSRNFSPDTLLGAVQQWKDSEDYNASLLFMECDNVSLNRRFTETRRTHPLAVDRRVADGIALERELLKPVYEVADYVIRTADLSIHDLKRTIRDYFAAESAELLTFVTSFSFRKGVPRDADMVLDVRFLRNPHYEEALRPLTGQNAAVAAYIEEDDGFPEFFTNLCTLLTPLLPRYREEGKSYFTIAVGCTGGKHRSVFIAEKLGKYLDGQGYKSKIRHRDKPKD